MRPTRRLALVLAVALAATGCSGDRAALIDPGESPVTAEVDDLRVLRHRDDPTDGDEWIDVLEADPEVFERTGTFREEGSRTAEDGEAADVRLLYEARAAGTTLLVRMDCRGCGDDGVPSTSVEDTELLAWELVSGAGGPERLDDAALVAGEVARVRVGDHLVVVRDAREDISLEPLPPEGALQLVASTAEPRRIDVFAAVSAGDAVATYGADEYRVRVEGA